MSVDEEGEVQYHKLRDVQSPALSNAAMDDDSTVVRI